MVDPQIFPSFLHQFQSNQNLWSFGPPEYRKNSKYWDMYVWANSVDSDQTALKEQSDPDLHCLSFFLHLLEALLQCEIKLFYIKDNCGS